MNFLKILKQLQSYKEVTFTGRTEAETPILCTPDGKSQLIRKDLDPGKDRRQKEKGMTEDEMVG